MQSAFVVGTATATVKHASLRGFKLLVVQPLLADGRSPDGDPVLALECCGAGRGDVVMMTSDGETAHQLVNDKTTPVRWTVLGIQDT